MQQPWPACRSAKGGLYTWSQSTPNSIILERVSCVSSTERLFTCAEPRCYFASPSVFIMMALFCLSVGGGYEHAIAWSSVILPYVLSVFFFISTQYVCLQLSPHSLSWKFRPIFSQLVWQAFIPLMLWSPNSLPTLWMIYNSYKLCSYCTASALRQCVDVYIQQSGCRLCVCFYVYIVKNAT